MGKGEMYKQSSKLIFEKQSLTLKKNTRKNIRVQDLTTIGFFSAKILSGGIALIGASGFNNPLALSAAMRVASAGLNL